MLVGTSLVRGRRRWKIATDREESEGRRGKRERERKKEEREKETRAARDEASYLKKLKSQSSLYVHSMVHQPDLLLAWILLRRNLDTLGASSRRSLKSCDPPLPLGTLFNLHVSKKRHSTLQLEYWGGNDLAFKHVTDAPVFGPWKRRRMS